MPNLTKTNRDYQSALCDFMVMFQGVTILDAEGNKVRKPDIFHAIYKNHEYVNENKHFDLSKDVTCQLLKSNNHPEYKCIERQYNNFNEAEAIKGATVKVLSKRAISMVRQKVKTEKITVVELITFVTSAMEDVHNHFLEIDRMIEEEIAS